VAAKREMPMRSFHVIAVLDVMIDAAGDAAGDAADDAATPLTADVPASRDIRLQTVSSFS